MGVIPKETVRKILILVRHTMLTQIPDDVSIFDVNKMIDEGLISAVTVPPNSEGTNVIYAITKKGDQKLNLLLRG
jgi:hypothetical protein